MTTMAVAEMNTPKELQQQLIDKAKREGGISYDDILALMPHAENAHASRPRLVPASRRGRRRR